MVPCSYFDATNKNDFLLWPCRVRSQPLATIDALFMVTTFMQLYLSLAALVDY